MEAYARVTAAVAVLTMSAYSKRIILFHKMNAAQTAIAREVMAHGLYISQPEVPVSAARRPPIQNQPAG
ncbi:Uncharacterised protein [Mycobacteroides abscessus subsp. abscessus]|nr:Uncharacterised protein [Mycobacteroides abscessus subsp. abscessus]SKN37447.1 Uncharacterised protein [Mycobacteroides abscessus subsp. abscessus]SKU43139.1 Uncharacterised protein [Mycobacteroides abscessus subsp. abscessus]